METEVIDILQKLNQALEAVGAMTPDAYAVLVRAEYLQGLFMMYAGLGACMIGIVSFITAALSHDPPPWLLLGAVLLLIGTIMATVGAYHMMTPEADVINHVLSIAKGAAV